MNAEVALDAYLATREGADDLDDLAPSEALISKRQRLLADAEEAKGSDPWPVGRQVDFARGNSSMSHTPWRCRLAIYLTEVLSEHDKAEGWFQQAMRIIADAKASGRDKELVVSRASFIMAKFVHRAWAVCSVDIP